MATFGHAQAVRGGVTTVCTVIRRWVRTALKSPSRAVTRAIRCAPTKAAMMQNIPIYEVLVQAFAAEGVDTHFTPMCGKM
jgi:hypothetical protein